MLRAQEEKVKLRLRVKEERMLTTEVSERSQKLWKEALSQFCHKGDKVAIYYPMKGELPIEALEEWLRSRGVEIYYPAAHKEYRWKKESETLPCPDIQLRLILVPGLAYSTEGVRLGRGGGWYDRMLSKHPEAVKVGCCYEAQILRDLPEEAHDQRVDWLMTEEGVI